VAYFDSASDPISASTRRGDHRADDLEARHARLPALRNLHAVAMGVAMGLFSTVFQL
jgi:hypothetical protein